MLRISRKTNYGLLFLAYLTKHYDKGLVSLNEVAQKNHLPLPYLRQLALLLHRAKLVESKEGSGGGYRLAKRPQEITISEVIMVFEKTAVPVACLDPNDACQADAVCPTRKIWQAVYGDMVTKFHTTTLEAFL